VTLALGVDPGAHGAFTVYDGEAGRIVQIDDMPTWLQAIGKKKRERIDALAVAELFDTYEMMGVELIVMESVGGRPQQSASAGFVFGYGVGLIYMAAVYSRIPMETVPAATWKALMRVPGKGKADDSAIMARAEEIFPHDRQLFYGVRGGKKVDRAEASMLAKFGTDHVLRADKIVRDLEAMIAYRRAETGA